MESLPLQGGRAHPVGSPSMKSLAHLHYFMCEAGSWDRERRVAARMSVVGTGRHLVSLGTPKDTGSQPAAPHTVVPPGGPSSYG